MFLINPRTQTLNSNFDRTMKMLAITGLFKLKVPQGLGQDLRLSRGTRLNRSMKTVKKLLWPA